MESSREQDRIMRKRWSPWSKLEDAAIPIADVDFADKKTVCIKIDKAAALPAVPVKRK